MNYYGQRAEDLRQGLGLSPRPQDKEEYIKRLGFRPQKNDDLYPGNKIPKHYHYGRIQNYDPQQMRLHKRNFNLVDRDSYLYKLAHGDEEAYEQMEAPALRQFTGLQGSIANRFSGAGLGGRKSSDFQNAQTAAASDFAQQLQANRLNLRRQAIQDLVGISHELLGQRPYEQMLAPRGAKKEGPWGGLIGGAGALAAGYFTGGNPAAIQAGYQVGNAAGSQIG